MASRLLGRLAIAAIVVVGAVTSVATPAEAVEVDPGLLSDSVYLSRGETAEVAQQIGAGAGDAAIRTGCQAIGEFHHLAGIACASAAATFGSAFVDAAVSARNDDNCLRIRYSKPGLSPGGLPILLGFYNDGRKHCRD